jgi:hypothetical protein
MLAGWELFMKKKTANLNAKIDKVREKAARAGGV